jgi:hypothetical protein
VFGIPCAGKYLFDQIDDTWTKANSSTYQKIGSGDVGAPCRATEHSEYYVTFTDSELPASTYSKSVSVDNGEPGSRPSCSIRTTNVAFKEATRAASVIAAASAKAKASIIRNCGTFPNEQCDLRA